ncbi:unnamed protein product, partial [Coccothraustes coccothraustes]
SKATGPKRHPKGLIFSRKTLGKVTVTFLGKQKVFGYQQAAGGTTGPSGGQMESWQDPSEVPRRLPSCDSTKGCQT